MDVDDILTFDDAEPSVVVPPVQLKRWKVLVIDDEPAVHDVTRLALQGFLFEERGLELVHGYCAAQARQLMKQHGDVAVLFLDVVMEHDQAGLDVVRYVREILRNRSTRIVLRTGQPGIAPEEWVISRYDINDYKEKTELTARKLYSLMHTCLRGYRDLCTIEDNKRGLELIIEASANLYRYGSLDKFTTGVLEQLNALLQLRGALMGAVDYGSVAAVKRDGHKLPIVAATGNFSHMVGSSVYEILSEEVQVRLESSLCNSKPRQTIHWDDKMIGIFRGRSGATRVLYLTGFRPHSSFDHHLVELFLRNVGASFDNLLLHEEIEETQREIVYRLGGAVETRSRETGNHVKRVAEMSELLGLLAGMPTEEAERLKYASPMHDVGKIGIPDAILNKPDKLLAGEWEIMKQHTQMGYELLKGSKRGILILGGIVALEHHEKWDGSGYPYGKCGEEIHLAARITALVDVFDALSSQRCYKDAWSFDAALDLIRAESGKHFDPRLVALFLARLPDFIAIKLRYPDEEDASPALYSPPHLDAGHAKH